MRAVDESGKHAQGTICYTDLPLHTVEGYVQLAGELLDMGCRFAVLKDMAALLQPQPAYDIIRGIKRPTARTSRSTCTATPPPGSPWSP